MAENTCRCSSGAAVCLGPRLQNSCVNRYLPGVAFAKLSNGEKNFAVYSKGISGNESRTFIFCLFNELREIECATSASHFIRPE